MNDETKLTNYIEPSNPNPVICTRSARTRITSGVDHSVRLTRTSYHHQGKKKTIGSARIRQAGRKKNNHRFGSHQAGREKKTIIGSARTRQ